MANSEQRDRLIVQNFCAGKARKVTELQIKRLFSAFGPATVTITPTNLAEEGASIAHVVYTKTNHAQRAFEAGQRRELVYKNRVLITSLVSADFAPINTLPNECLIEIFSRLPVKDKYSVKKVCRRWRELPYIYWANEKRLCVPNFGTSKEKFTEYVAQRGKYSEEIEFFLESLHQTPIIREHCENLNSMIIRIVKRVTDKCYDSLSSLLEELSITRVMFQFEENRETPNPGVPFGKVLSKLSEKTTEIHIVADRWGYHFGTVEYDLSRFHELRALSLHNFPMAEYNFIGFEELNNLVCLALDGCKADYNFVKKIKNLTKLEYLSLPNFDSMDNILQSIVENHGHLKFLSVTGESRYSSPEISLAALSQLQYLTVLHLRRFFDTTFQHIFGFPSLHFLILDSSPRNLDELKRVVQNSPCMRGLTVDICAPLPLKELFSQLKTIVKMKSNGSMLYCHPIHSNTFVWRENDTENVMLSDLLRRWAAESNLWCHHDKIHRLLIKKFY